MRRPTRFSVSALSLGFDERRTVALTIFVEVGAVAAMAAVGDFCGFELRLGGIAGGDEEVDGVARAETTLEVEVGEAVKTWGCILMGTGATAAGGLTTSCCWCW